MFDPVGNYFDGQSLGVADGFFAGFAVRHHAREFQRFGDPAPIVFAVQLDGKVHIVMVQQAVVSRVRQPSRLRESELRSYHMHKAEPSSKIDVGRAILPAAAFQAALGP
jgi:hypothetical protein